MAAPSINEVLRYMSSGDEALFFAILENPGEALRTLTPDRVKGTLGTADPRQAGRLFELLGNLKHEPKVESLLVSLMEDAAFQQWRAASEGLFYNRSDDARFDGHAIGDRLRRSGLVDRAEYWDQLGRDSRGQH